MKTAKEYIYEGLSHSYNLRDVIDNLTDEQICEVIEQAQKESYNQALEDAVEAASCEYEKDYLTGEIDKESILKLKK